MKKLYYSISEVSKITDLEQYVLRYWETEFDLLKPAKNLAGNRIYTNKDIKLILYIKRLLRDEKYTIEGAKKLLRNYNIKEDSSAYSGLKDLKHPEKKKPSAEPEPKTARELSLFNAEAGETDVELNKHLKGDLRELKNFLNELLDELD
ncbi:MAG: MerR family transcriptional regulator [Ignavibacteria bacterium]|nr:MerR family transcriptional regulator [Ignavibacteria bacterium]